MILFCDANATCSWPGNFNAIFFIPMCNLSPSRHFVVRAVNLFWRVCLFLLEVCEVVVRMAWLTDWEQSQASGCEWWFGSSDGDLSCLWRHLLLSLASLDLEFCVFQVKNIKFFLAITLPSFTWFIIHFLIIELLGWLRCLSHKRELVLAFFCV